MLSTIFPIISLFIGLSILLLGNSLLAILLGLKAGVLFGETITGILMAGYFIGFIAGSFVVPRVILSVGHIRTFVAMAALGSVAAISYSVFTSPLSWWLLRVISGICMLGIYMVVESWLSEQSPGVHRGRIFGIYMTVTLIATGLGLLLQPLSGNIETLAPFVLASVMFTLGLVPVAITPMPQPKPIQTSAAGLRKLFAISPTGFMGAAVSGLVNGILWGLGPIYWRDLGLSNTEAAMFMALIIAGGAFLQWPIGHLSDKRDRRRVLGVVCFAAAVAVLLTSYATNLPRVWMAIFAFGYGGFMLTVYSLSVTHVNDRVPPSVIPETARTLLLLYGVGAAIGPMMAGPFMEYFGATSFAVISASMLIFLAVIALHQTKVAPPVPPEEQVVFVPMTRTSEAVVDMLPGAVPIIDKEERKI